MRRPSWVLVGGRLRRGEAATIPVWSAAVRWGAGLFETVGCDGGRPLLWDAHAARLESGLASLGWSGGRIPSREDVERLLERTGVTGSGVLRVLALGSARRASVVAWAARNRPPRRARRLGVRVEAVVVPSGPLTGLKSCSYLPYRWARARARDAGADGALLIDDDGAVREGDAANLFIAHGGAVATPPAPRRCLPGVMRAWCIEVLTASGVAVAERDITGDELRAAEEAWLTSSLAGIVPIARVGDVLLPVPRTTVDMLARFGIPAPGCRRR